MTKWEYSTLVLKWHEMDTYIEAKGAEGWECYAVSERHEDPLDRIDIRVFYFKRPIVEPAPKVQITYGTFNDSQSG